MENKLNVDCIIGIDPGAAGGLAVYVPGQRVAVVKMPKDTTELSDFFKYYSDNFNPIVFLEKLTIRPDDVLMDGGRASMGKLYRIQKMMANYEHLKALIETFGIPFIMVHPASWQTKLSLRVKGQKEEKGERKRRYADVAQRLYPFTKVTLWNADALLIMHFGRFALENLQSWVKEQLPVRIYEKLI